MTTTNSKKTIDDNFCYRADFKYTHDNPYHDKLAVFDSFVLRDEEAESNVGKWKQMFQNNQPLEVEIGTGYGEFMMEYCQKNPEINFIGLDHRFKRSFGVAKKLDKLEHKNFRYLRARGERIEFMFDESEVQSIFYFFPDPWPKTRHHKKRLCLVELFLLKQITTGILTGCSITLKTRRALKCSCNLMTLELSFRNISSRNLRRNLKRYSFLREQKLSPSYCETLRVKSHNGLRTTERSNQRNSDFYDH
jgi:tRNA (guanine-N(7)-)-methyltransferase